MEIHGNVVRKGMRGRRIAEKCDKLHTSGDNAANKGKLVDSSNKPLLQMRWGHDRRQCKCGRYKYRTTLQPQNVQILYYLLYEHGPAQHIWC
jgi:hypothetical protein